MSLYQAAAKVALYTSLGVISLVAPSSAPQGTLESALGGSAHAQERVAATAKAPTVQYKTVDDILKGTPFKKVDHKGYLNEVGGGRVVAFFYDNEISDSGSGRLATVLTQIAAKYPNLKYVALKREDSVKDDSYMKFGYEVSPDFMVYDGGKIVFRNPGKSPTGKQGGGPNPGREQVWIDGLQKDLERVFGINQVGSLNQ